MNLKSSRTSMIICVAFAVMLSAFWFMPNLAFVVFLSLLLKLLLQPAVNKLSMLPKTVAAGVVLSLFIGFFGGMLMIVASAVVPSFQSFVADFPGLVQKLQDTDFFGLISFNTDWSTFWEKIIETGSTALKSSFFFILSLFNKFVDIVIIVFVAFYLLADGEKIGSFLIALFPDEDRERMERLFERILSSLRAYIYSQIVICMITGSIVFLYFTLRGIPYAPVFGLISGVAEFVPVLGPTVASILGTALTATMAPWLAVETLGFYVLLTQANHNIIYPNLIGKSMGLHPVAIILAIILFGEIRGAAGMFLAVPIVVIIKAVAMDVCADRARRAARLQEAYWLRRNE